MGIVGDLLGEDHPLNIPNSYGGLLFFPVMLVLGRLISKQMKDLRIEMEIYERITDMAYYTSLVLHG